MPGPAATIGSMHICPMTTSKVPHVGGPISGPGVPTVLIGGKPAAVIGDMCTCSGPPDTIAQGEATVIIGGKPAATLGSMTAHGGIITVGEPTVLIGTGSSGTSTIMPLNEIPFPEINAQNRLLGGAAPTEEQEKQDQLKEESKKHGYLSDFDLSV